MEGSESPTAATGSTTGPTSFSDASLTWSGDSSSPTPAPSTPAATPADATAPPAVPALADGSTPAAGEPPKERWDAILANARTKAAQDATAQFEAQYGWAKQIPQQEIQQIQQIGRHFSPGGNPIEGLQSLIAEIRKDPQYDAQLKSLAAKALAQGRQPAAPATPQMVQVQLEDGLIVTLPRNPDEWLAHQQQQWEQSLEKRLQPLQKTHEQLQAERQAIQQQQAVTQFVSTTYADVQTWPGMDAPESKAAVAQELAQAKVDPNDPREVRMALDAAWRKVVAPTLGQKAEAKLLASLKTKATAGAVNPSGAAAASPRQVGSFYDPSLKWK
jgi:hypothetical protein